MRRILGSVLLLYATLICFGDAFKPHPWVPIPLAVLLLGVVVAGWSALLAPRIRLDHRFFRPFDVLLLAYVIDLGLSLLLSGHIEAKNINHLVAYTTVVGLDYFFVKYLFAADDTFAHYERRIRTALAFSVFLVSAYAIVEFIDTNITGLGITSLVRFTAAQAEYQPLFLVFVRARGFMGESGMLALFLNAFVPMCFVHLRRTRGMAPALAFLAVAAGAFAVTFSAAGLAFIAVGALVAIGMYAYDRGVLFVPLRWTVVLACVVVLMGGIAVSTPSSVWTELNAKLTLEDPTSAGDRLRHWSEAAPIAAEHPLWGTGIGSTSAESGQGVVSFYLTMLKEAGVPSLILIVAFLSAVFGEIAALPRRDPFKYVYSASFVAAVCHYAIISDIWYPWLWLLCVFAIGERRVTPAGAFAMET
jgi:O-antigen ligase/polysaccharide polymerase Wzy-like membrane protein